MTLTLSDAIRSKWFPPPLPEDRASPAAFATHYSRGQWLPAPHLALMEQACLQAIDNGRRVILSVSVRHGKALDIDTPIPTPDGWSPIGKLKEGDRVFDETGAVRTVVGAFEPYEADAVECRFSDGTSIVSDGPHKWLTYSYQEHQALGQWRRHNGIPHRSWPTDWALGQDRSAARSPKVRTSADMAGGRFYIPTALALDGPEVGLPVDPYVLGVWLGDGTSRQPIVHTADQFIEDEIGRRGFETNTGKGYGPLGRYIRGLRAGLIVAGVLGQKHVPSVYLRAAPAQRLALLQGLMDSDGGVVRSTRNTGRVSFTNQNRQLADAVAELFVSLGAKVTRDERPAKISGRATGATAYRVSCSPPFQPFRLPRKADAFADDSKGSLTRRTRVLTEVVPAGRRLVRCIAVDSPSHLYLAGESMIPTHNTDYVRWFMAWYLATHPDARVILASHEADFAARGGRAVRDVLIEHGRLFGVSVSKRSEAANRWDLERPNQGGMLTVGVGGSPIGRGADLLVVDDPVKNYAEAMSPLIRQRVQEWWTGTMVSRIEPGGAVILIMARWHEDDLAGFLLREAPDEWTELRLPAIADDPDDLLGRDIGEALWPERYPLDELERRHKETALLLGEAVWLAQFQQTPRAPEGGMFPEARWGWLQTIHIGLEPIRWVRAWDLAASEGEGDFTAGVLMGRLSDGRFLVRDVRRGRWSADQVRFEIRKAANEDPHGTAIELPQDPGQAGKDQAQQLARMLAGFDVRTRPQTGSKEVRATGLAAQQQAGNVLLFEDRAWNGAFVSELAGFPRGTHDDAVDAAATAFNSLAGLMTATRSVQDRRGVLRGTR
jgi:predicted phage terminase large subunit-like protein